MIASDRPLAAHPYAGARAVIATMHGKASVIAPPLRAIGLDIEAATGLDTDALGTFTGETPRAGTMLEAAVAKARLGMAAARRPIGVASEGSFGPHPVAPFIAAATELIVLVDDDLGLVVKETMTSETTNFAHATVTPGDAAPLAQFLRGAGFPAHAVVVRPNEGPGPVRKGLVDQGEVGRAIAQAAALSADGLARLETDMRAHLNPTRMAQIGRLAERFAGRLSRLCPACGAPGFGPVRSEPGLPCADCGAPTALVKATVSECVRCPHTLAEGRSDGLAAASPAQCPECNP
jgi:hypothetical protein